MIHWFPTWQQSLGAAVVLAIGGRLLRARRPGGRRAAFAASFAWEAGILLGLYALWQYAGRLAQHTPAGAFTRGDALWHVERVLHLPSEAWLQSLVLPHPGLVRGLNAYYGYAHVNGLLLTFLWLFVRHRSSYAPARTALALTTFGCLAIQLIPVAPPRLLDAGPGGGSHGVVDTAIVYGQSVYGPVGQGLSDQFAAMPSVHVAWAAAIAVFIWRSGRGPWRYLGVAHLVLTVVVVVSTGNHYWADGIVAAAILGVSLLIAARLQARTRQRLPLPEQREARRASEEADQAARTGPSSSLLRSQTGSGSSASSST